VRGVDGDGDWTNDRDGLLQFGLVALGQVNDTNVARANELFVEP
jgi:hypothetical protein